MERGFGINKENERIAGVQASVESFSPHARGPLRRTVLAIFVPDCGNHFPGRLRTLVAEKTLAVKPAGIIVEQLEDDLLAPGRRIASGLHRVVGPPDHGLP